MGFPRGSGGVPRLARGRSAAAVATLAPAVLTLAAAEKGRWDAWAPLPMLPMAMMPYVVTATTMPTAAIAERPTYGLGKRCL
jgi:hypothetical protein